MALSIEIISQLNLGLTISIPKGSTRYSQRRFSICIEEVLFFEEKEEQVKIPNNKKMYWILSFRQHFIIFCFILFKFKISWDDTVLKATQSNRDTVYSTTYFKMWAKNSAIMSSVFLLRFSSYLVLFAILTWTLFVLLYTFICDRFALFISYKYSVKIV